MGGAVFNFGGSFALTNCTLTANTALGGNAGAGGIAAGNGLGGAVFNLDGTLTLLFSTLSGNSAAQGGRDVYNLGAAATASAALTDSILGQADTAVSDFQGNAINGGTSATSGTNDLIRTAIGFSGGIVSQADPMLGPLANNGGPTQTMALLPGSPALSAGVPLAGISTDQRGLPRVSGGMVDLGAFEVQRILLSPATLPGGTFARPYRQTITATEAGYNGSFGFAVTAGALPPGLGLTGDGTLHGTPTAAGLFAFTVTATDSNGLAGQQPYTLIVTSAPTTTRLRTPSVSTTYNSTTAQTVTVSAAVASPLGGTLNEGNVLFSVNGQTVAAAVSNGVATATLSVAPATPAGAYALTAVYVDGPNAFGAVNFAASSAVPGTLTINTASTAVSVSKVTATFNGAAQTVTLTATVTSARGGTVNEGSVTFAVANLPAVTAVVQSGVASATLSLPGGMPAGSYSIGAAYADVPNANGSVNYAASAATGQLRLAAADTVTTAVNASTTFSSAAQVVTLRANVVSPNGGTVNEGIVTFGVGSLTAQGIVAFGTATAALVLPLGLAAGRYAIVAHYADVPNGNGAVNFNSSHAAPPGTLTINAAGTAVSTNDVTVRFSPLPQQVTLTATVSSPDGGIVNEGLVEFDVAGRKVLGRVQNGVATAVLALPGGFAAGSYPISASYADAAGNYLPSSGGGTLTVLAPGGADSKLGPRNAAAGGWTTAVTARGPRRPSAGTEDLATL
jgi:hypothetical protein